mmetsp:Transcript_63648/g.205085  ORF Transcript_63648/g.205085 Transcript_63648/m.205085 type:complete len:322 (+) Transcript_63648:64-1029(+)
MPSTCRPLRAACCLAALAAAVREGSESEAQAGLGLAGASNLAAEDLPSWVWSLKYFVFVKKGAVAKLGGMAGWHTETSFCLLKPSGDEKAAKQLLQQQLDKDPKSMDAKLIEQAKTYFSSCLVTGHPGTNVMHLEDFAGDKFFFSQVPLGERKLYYVGLADFKTYWRQNGQPPARKERSLAYFLEDMRICGSWERPDYGRLNANHYTDALMKALHFRTPTTHSKLEKNRDRELGYYDVELISCKGAKCGVCSKGVCKKVTENGVGTGATACFWIPQMTETEEKLTSTESGTRVCPKDTCFYGFCYAAHGIFNPNTRACLGD